jgi:hypothetical protein
VSQDHRDAPASLRLLTITGLWRMPRAVHSLGVIRMTWFGPISYRLIGYTTLIFGSTWLLFHLAHVPQLGPGMTVRWVLPIAIIWWALRVAAGGGRATELAWSWAVTGARIAVAGLLHAIALGGRRTVRIAAGGIGPWRRPVTLWGQRPALTLDELEQLADPTPLERVRARVGGVGQVIGSGWSGASTAGTSLTTSVTAAVSSTSARVRGLVPTVSWQRTRPAELSAEDLDALLAEPARPRR